MRITYVLFGLTLVASYVTCSPIVKREAEAEDLSPLNEVYLFEMDDDQAATGDRADRDKRKIGVLKLGVTNGIINFVFGKLDSFLDSKTRALSVLDESNKIKNAAFGIDNSQSATGQFISHLVSQKIQAASGSIGPVINSATTLLSGAKSGLAGALVSKLAPLSSISSGVATGLAAGASGSSGSTGGGAGTGVTLTATKGVNANLLSGILSTAISALPALSQSSNAVGGASGGTSGGSAPSGSDGASGGLNLGAFANIGGGGNIPTTTEDIPEFDRNKVSLDIPAPAFGAGFTLITNVSKVLSSVILNSARRTQTFLELFKPFFRGAFAIKGLPSDSIQ